MSFAESEFSDLLEKAEAEELYNNVQDMVSYVDDNVLHDNMPDNFRHLGTEETMDLKQELTFNDFALQSDSLLVGQPQMQLQQLQQLPPVFNIPATVCNEEYAGPFNFDVSIIPNGSKNPWVYSSTLNKVFIDMGSHFPVDFRVTSRPVEPLYIRVMPSFSSLQYSQELVFRCVQHEQAQLNKNIPEHIRQHIIRCSSNDGAIYLGDRNENRRLSIIFPFAHPQTGTDAVREMFLFVCKNSCPTGMNRKPIEIIFTLESYNGDILGRRILNVRICSCPKRDKEKEEKDAWTKGSAPQGKKRKIEGKVEKKASTVGAKDSTIHTVTIDVCGKHNVEHVLKYCQDLMAGDMMRNPQNSDPFLACYKKLQGQMNQLQL